MKKNVCVFCATPFQIFNAIVLKNDKWMNDEVNIYLLDYFKEAENYVNNLKNSKMFNEVRFIKTNYIYRNCTTVREGKKEIRFICDKLGTWLYRFKYYSEYKSIVEKNNILIKEGSEIIYSFNDPLEKIINIYCNKMRYIVSFYGYEDGIANYYNTQYTKRELIDKLFGVSYNVFKKELYYLYNPKLALDEDVFIKKINLEKNKVKDLVNKVFGYKKEWKIDESIIFFDGAPEQDNLYSEIIKIFSKLIKEGEQIVCKKHPRRKDMMYEDTGIKIYEHQSIPFEVCCLNEDLSNKILISFFSSACINPKNIFDQEPEIILLYKLMEKIDIEFQEKNDMIDRLKKLYRNPEKIHVPESLKDFEETIKKIINKKR